MKIKIKNGVFIGLYVLILVIELFFCVPYEEIEIFRSKQNVPHTEILKDGYATLDEIGKDEPWVSNKDKISIGKRVDSGQLMKNLFLTTLIAAAIYFIFVHSADKIREIKAENELLQKKVCVLNSDNQNLCEYRTLLTQFETVLDEIKSLSPKENINDENSTAVNQMADEQASLFDFIESEK